MPNVTQLVPNFLGGVSRQNDIKKLPGQVRECINGYADPTFGLIKRPGFQFLSNLANNTNTGIVSAEKLKDAKWFFYLRDNTEAYFGAITSKTSEDDSRNRMYIWNAITQRGCTIIGLADADGFTDVAEYLNDHTLARDDFDVLTIQDYTIITNKTKATQLYPERTLDRPEDWAPGKQGTVQLVIVEYGATYKVTINDVACEYKTITSNNPETDTEFLDADDILNGLKADIEAKTTGITVTKLNTTLELSSDIEFTMNVEGGITGASLFGFQTDVKNESQLPEQSVEGRIARIVNFETTLADDVWVGFTPTNGTQGEGLWQEIKSPAVSLGFDPETMPIALENIGVDTFEVKQIPWVVRQAGDDETNKAPSFVGYPITKVFLQDNRLGFLSRDNVIFSQASDFFNFWKKSALTLTAGDPVDVSTNNIRPSILYSCLPTTQGLVLFSRLQQFLLTSIDGPITPFNVKIDTLSNYEVDTSIEPVDVGTNLAFVSKNSGYTKVYGYVTRGENNNPLALDLSKVVSDYIPSSITRMDASPQNDFIVLSDVNSRTMYIYRTFSDGTKNIIQAWTKWEMPGEIQMCIVINDTWFVVVKTVSKMCFCIAPIDQIESGITVGEESIFGNPALDLYCHPENDAFIEVDGEVAVDVPFTIYLFDQQRACLMVAKPAQGPALGRSLLDLPILRNNIQIPYADPEDEGYYVMADRVEGRPEGGATMYFKGDRLTQYSPDDVVCGLVFDFDVELPRTYFKLDPADKISDYSATTTISRYKIAAGLTGAMTFKVIAHGRDAWGPVYPNEWEDVESIYNADHYRANEAPITEEHLFDIPIHQRSENFKFKIFSDLPYPTTLISMMWEGNYSPKYYKRK